jgi:hypothetical protein
VHIGYIMESKELLIAPKVDAITPYGVADMPFTGRAFNFIAMKMIEDLGMRFANSTSKQSVHQAIYECPFCGSIFKANKANVDRGHTQSCGCLFLIAVSRYTEMLGISNTKDYGVWKGIKGRTTMPNHSAFKYYGARGIKLCDEWINDPKLFIEYIRKLPNYGKKGYTIDRIDNDGNYELGNLRWASRHIQNTNERKRNDNASGYIGVGFFARTHNHWYACIGVNKKQIHLGYFKTPKEAAIARNNYIIENNLTEYKLNEVN